MAPTNISCAALPAKVILSWSSPSNKSLVSGYNVLRRLSTEKNFVKINSSAVKGVSFADSSVSSGKNYEYKVVSVDSKGSILAESGLASAPNITMTERVVIVHQGRIVPAAMPGDAMEYMIEYTNKGFGYANNVSILHSVPKGTVLLANSAAVKKGPAASVLYMDKKTGKWSDGYSSVADVAKVKYVLKEPVASVSRGPSGILSLKVVVEY